MGHNAHEVVEKGMAAMTTKSVDEDVMKAFTTADFAGGAGLMLPESSNRFLRKVIEQPHLLGPASGVTVELMKAPTKNIDRIGFGSRILETLTEDTDIPTETKPTATQIVLSTTEFGALVPASYTLIEDILEGKMNGGQEPGDAVFIETLQDLMLERVAVDLEEIVINSDLLSADTTLDEFDGALVLPSNTYDHGGAVIDTALFEGMLAKLPTPYLQRMAGLKFIVGPRTNLFLRSHLGKRGTSLGDRALTETPDGQLSILGVPVFVIGTMPETLGASSDKGKALLLHPGNMRVGLWRQVMIEVERVPKKRRYEFNLSLRAGMKYEDPDGVVLGKEFKVAA